MKKSLKVLVAAASLFVVASCGSNSSSSLNSQSASVSVSVEEKYYDGYAVGVGFAGHGDVAYANVKVDGSKNITQVEVREVFGIRSCGNIVNNRTYNEDGSEKTAQADIDKCNSIAAENKVVSEIASQKNYESYKYLLVGGKLLICQASGAAPVYNEDAENGYQDVNTLLKNNDKEVINWWIDAVVADDFKFLKVAGEGEEVVKTTTSGTNLAVMKSGFDSFYGPSCYKDQNYTSKVPNYAASFKNLNDYILANGVDFDVESDSFTTSCSLQSAESYIAIAKEAYNNACAKIAA